jgi:two-component system cell cycle sensor histidine kinase/response regulator CckA
VLKAGLAEGRRASTPYGVLAGSDLRLLQAIRAGNIGIFDHDHRADVIYWSPELRQMFGWDADEPVTLPKILSHVHAEDAERVSTELRRAHSAQGNGSFDIEHRIIDRRGRLRWVLNRSQTHFEGFASERRPTRTIGAVQDVTQLRQAEERLRVLDTVLSSSAQAIGIADCHGILTFANAALCRLWGFGDREELLGRSLFELWKGGEGPAALLAQVRANRIQRLEMPAQRRDGSAFHLGLTAEAVCDARGQLTQVLVTFMDVSDRKRLEAEFIHAQKMEYVGQLAGGVAHDFNNLLTVISSGIQLGLAAALPAAIAGGLRDAAQAARSATALTRQLLAFSRKQPMAPTLLDLNEALRRMETMVVRLLGEGVRLFTSYAENLPPIRFDRSQLEQILLNLAANARDAMPEGGVLDVTTSLAPANQGVVLSLTDNGIGMSEATLARVFEPFFTTKEVGKGTGLGLAMVSSSVEQNGGRIEVASELGRGTTFKLYLPAAQPDVTGNR